VFVADRHDETIEPVARKFLAQGFEAGFGNGHQHRVTRGKVAVGAGPT